MHRCHRFVIAGIRGTSNPDCCRATAGPPLRHCQVIARPLPNHCPPAETDHSGLRLPLLRELFSLGKTDHRGQDGSSFSRTVNFSAFHPVSALNLALSSSISFAAAHASSLGPPTSQNPSVPLMPPIFPAAGLQTQRLGQRCFCTESRLQLTSTQNRRFMNGRVT